MENYKINSDLISQEEMAKRWEEKIIGLLPKLKKNNLTFK